MNSDIIPQNIRDFILQNIDSVAQLEALLIFQSNPQDVCDSETIVHTLFIDKPQAELILNRLLGQGFIIEEPKGSKAYRYQPKSEELVNIAKQVAELYQLYLVPVTNLIHSKPKAKMQQFADAFKIRKD